MNKPKYTIAVTGLNAIDSPGPGLAVIKGLKEAASFDVRIIGLSYEALEPGIYLHDFVDKTYQVPYPSAGQDVLFDRLQYIKEQEGTIDFLFPNFDAELYNFIKLQCRLLLDLGIKMFLPTIEQFESRQKVNLYEFGLKHNLKVPYARLAFNSAELPALAKHFNYPLVVKGKFYDAWVAYTNDQAVQYFNKISAQWGLPILIQEFVTGTEVNVCGIGDGEGNLIGAVPMRKLYITDKGKAWAGISLDDPALLDITRTMVEKTKWKGPFEMEFVKTVNDDYYLLEINPRFPAWCYLAVGAGQNQMEAMVNLAMGKEVKPFETYKVGTLFIRYSNDLIVDIKEFEKISTDGEL
jgi:carbamoyl-phosphate synthase large subunit